MGVGLGGGGGWMPCGGMGVGGWGWGGMFGVPVGLDTGVTGRCGDGMLW